MYQQRLPNELLSNIVSQALLSPRLSSITDELFIQPKCKMAFQSLSSGFGISCRKYRAVFLREWFRVFHVQETDDLDQVVDEHSGTFKFILVAGFIRELYFHEPLILLPSHFIALTNLHTISYPLQPIRTASGNSNPSATPQLDRGVRSFPLSLQKLELRDANTCSPEELRSINISSLVSLTNLRVTCCEDDGAWGPIPSYVPPTCEGKPFGKLSRGRTLAHLMESYVSVFSPLKSLRTLSLDVHFTDNTLFPPDHPAPGPNPNPNPPFILQAPLLLHNFFHGFFANPIPLPQPPLHLLPALPLPAHLAPQTVAPCRGDNSCHSCWEIRVEGTKRRELLATKMLARGLKHLETVEWTVWFREQGTGEERRRVLIDRNANQSRVSGNLLGEAESPKVAKTAVKQPTNRNGGAVEDEEESEGEGDVLLKEGTTLEFACRTSKVPLALYPAVLG